MNLYKVKLEIEVMTMAENTKKAIEIAKNGAVNEMEFSIGKSYLVNNDAEIPKEWKELVPYSEYSESRTCKNIVKTVDKEELPKEEIEVILKAKEGSKNQIIEENDTKPESRPDPKPLELDWHETKTGKPLPSLRFLEKKID